VKASASALHLWKCLFLIACVSCGGRSNSTAPRILINEVLPSGENYDWIELYNTEGKPIHIGGFYLSDTEDNLTKWRIPRGTILGASQQKDGGAFLVVSLRAEVPGLLSADFGLDPDEGEEVILTAPDTVTIVDRVRIPPLRKGAAWARDPSDPQRWTFTSQPTEGTENSIVGLGISIIRMTKLLPYRPFRVVASILGDLAHSDDEPSVLIFYQVEGLWRSAPMQPAGIEGTGPESYRRKLFSFTLTGEDLKPQQIVRVIIAARHRDGSWITAPSGKGFDPEAGPGATYPSYAYKVGDPTTLSLRFTEVMPSNTVLTGLIPARPTSTPDWIELYNWGPRRICLTDFTVIKGPELPPPAARLSWRNPQTGDCALPVPPGERVLLFADESWDTAHLPFRLSRRGETLRFGQWKGENFVEIDVLHFDTIPRNTAFGRTDPNEPGGKILPLPTPRLANPPDGGSLWFVDPGAVWISWGGEGDNPSENDLVTVHAEIVWPTAWMLRGAPPEEVPQVTLWYSTGFSDPLEGESAPMLRPPTEAGVSAARFYTFETEIGPFPAGTTLRYLVEARNPVTGEVLYHGAKGATGTPPDPSDCHVFLVGDPSTPVRITEIGLGEDFERFEAQDGSGEVSARRTFVEFYNFGNEAVDLNGCTLSILPGRKNSLRGFLEPYRLQDFVIPAGSYAVLWLDGDPADGRPSLLEHYLGGSIYLYDRPERGKGVIDRLSFPELAVYADRGAFGRTAEKPEGQVLPPTPGAPNAGPPHLLLNELGFEDGALRWVEIYNAGKTEAPLSGLHLGNAVDELPVYRVTESGLEEPSGTVLPSGFEVIWIGEAEVGRLVCKLPFDPEADDVFLFLPLDWPWGADEDFEPLRIVRYASAPCDMPTECQDVHLTTRWCKPEEGKSLARQPDGGCILVHASPSPGTTNVQLQPVGIFLSEIYPAGQDGFIELVNAREEQLDLSGALLEVTSPVLEPGETLTFVVQEGTLVEAKRFVALHTAGLPPRGTVKLWLTVDGVQSLVDEVTWPVLEEGSAWARIPELAEGPFTPAFESLPPSPGEANQVPFIRGDCNGDGAISATPFDPQWREDPDFKALLTLLSTSGAVPPCWDACDINDDGRVDPADITFMIRNLFFTENPQLPPPFPDPGREDRADGLPCR